MKLKTLPLLAVLLAACASTSQPAVNAATDTVEPAIQPQLTPSELLLRTLELAKSIDSVADITPERVKAVYGISEIYINERGDFSFGERATSLWAHGVDGRRDRLSGEVNEFSMVFVPVKHPIPPEPSTPTEEICAISAQEFISKSEAAGFIFHSPIFDYHPGVKLGYIYSNRKVVLYVSIFEIYNPEPNERECVDLIILE